MLELAPAAVVALKLYRRVGVRWCMVVHSCFGSGGGIFVGEVTDDRYGALVSGLGLSGITRANGGEYLLDLGAHQ